MNPKNIKVFYPEYHLILKVTKLLGKTSQFEFLVMTEKKIFAHKLFLSLNISDFNLFLCDDCTPDPPPPHQPLQKGGHKV